MQLVQLQQAQQRFKDQGIGLAAISYDSQAILKDFAERQHITFPLLADPQSEIIRKYGVLNVEAKNYLKIISRYRAGTAISIIYRCDRNKLIPISRCRSFIDVLTDPSRSHEQFRRFARFCGYQ